MNEELKEAAENISKEGLPDSEEAKEELKAINEGKFWKEVTRGVDLVDIRGK